MGELTNTTEKKANKLRKLVDEMKSMDRFRQRQSEQDRKIVISVCTPNGTNLTNIYPDNFEGLNDNILGLVEVAFNKRYDEITKILNDEFGGAYTEVNDD
ncbi:hypothetical protein [Enterococcus sp. AZ101]|uniref:hypothetical protein n=1 Tax=Enterococcus sp. AZ101 TaxID=2774742 RepID=UPI003D29FE2F